MRRTHAVSVILAAFLLGGCNADQKQLFGRAEARWREGNYDDALRLFTLLYEREPQGEYAGQALLHIGNIYYLNLRRMRDAIQSYEKLIEELPGRREEPIARVQLAKIFENEIGDLSAAIVQYDRLLEIKNLDDRAEVLYLRANAYFKKEEFTRALRELRQLEESGVSGHLAHQVALKIGAIYQIQRKYDDALPYFRKVAEAPCPECRRQAILDLAETYEALYDFNQAIETIRRLDPDPQNEALIDREVQRLEQLRKKADSGPVLSWRSHR